MPSPPARLALQPTITSCHLVGSSPALLSMSYTSAFTFSVCSPSFFSAHCHIFILSILHDILIRCSLHISRSVTQQDIEDFVRQRFFTPLGLDDVMYMGYRSVPKNVQGGFILLDWMAFRAIFLRPSCAASVMLSLHSFCLGCSVGAS